MLRFALLAGLLAVPGLALPGDAPPGGPAVALLDLVREALARSPELASARERLEAMRARVPQAGALPDPTLMSGVINEGRPVPFETLGTADFSEVYVGISQAVPFPGKRSLREDVARGEASAERWAYEALRRRMSLAVAQRYCDLHAARDALAALERSSGLLDSLARVARERFAVGQGSERDVLAAEVELSRLEERRSLLRGQEQLLQVELARLLGRSEERPLGRLEPLSATSLAGTPAELLAAAEASSPLLQERQARVQAAADRLELARAERLPDVGLELVYHDRGRRELDPYYGVGATVTLPVYASRKQSRAIEEAAAELRAARSAVAEARAELRYAVTAAYLRVQTSAHLLRLYDEGLLQQGRLVLDSSLAQYRVGRAPFESVTSSGLALLEDEIAYRDQLAAHEKAAAELAVYTGSPAFVPAGDAAEEAR